MTLSLSEECLSIKRMYLFGRIDYVSYQLVDLQVFVAPRITLKHLVPTFPCFSSMVVSLMEKVRGKVDYTK